MVFNPDKCEHIRITNKLNETKKKNIRVTVDSTLSWNSRTDIVTKRAIQAIFFLSVLLFVIRPFFLNILSISSLMS